MRKNWSFSLPMRDGNLKEYDKPLVCACFSLPMRDGNPEPSAFLWGLVGFSLPMRDGNSQRTEQITPEVKF